MISTTAATVDHWGRCVDVLNYSTESQGMYCRESFRSLPFNVAATSHSTCSSLLREHADCCADYSWNSHCLSSGLFPLVHHTRPSLPGCIKQVSNSSNYSHIYPNNASLIAFRSFGGQQLEFFLYEWMTLWEIWWQVARAVNLALIITCHHS